MKSGVEAGDLRKLRGDLRERKDGGQIVRLVQRGQRNQSLQIGDNALVEPDCPVVAQTSMHHPMAGSLDFHVAGTLLQPAQDIAQGAGMVQRRTARPLIPLVDFPAGRVLDLKARIAAQTFHLAFEQQVRLRLAAVGEDGELDAGRAGVDHQYPLFHGAHPPAFSNAAPLRRASANSTATAQDARRAWGRRRGWSARWARGRRARYRRPRPRP
jgi:hypothetical protein